jgi:heme exporter protein D
MMAGLGEHAAFIIAAYAVVAIVLAGLIAWIVHDARTQTRLLAELEARGVRRRSARKSNKQQAKRAAP